jgi:hypothetical protein
MPYKQRALKPLAERLWERTKVINDDDSCWIFQGAIATNGYGTISVGRRGEGMVYAHVASYTLTNGPVPIGHEVRHLCEGRYAPDDPMYKLCVRPSHLDVGTHSQNARDALRSGRLKGYIR